MKRLPLALFMMCFGITLAILIGRRMSTDAMAVVIGVAVGVAAGIPTSLLVVALFRRDAERERWRMQEPPPQLPAPINYPYQAPPVVFLDPNQVWKNGQGAPSGLGGGGAYDLLPRTGAGPDEWRRNRGPDPGRSCHDRGLPHHRRDYSAPRAAGVYT